MTQLKWWKFDFSSWSK